MADIAHNNAKTCCVDGGRSLARSSEPAGNASIPQAFEIDPIA
jgi:hypothetical protein